MTMPSGEEKSLDLCEKETVLIKGFETTIRGYARHVFRCYSLAMNMENMCPRELDTILVKSGYPQKGL